jgi:hypothetical protein
VLIFSGPSNNQNMSMSLLRAFLVASSNFIHQNS